MISLTSQEEDQPSEHESLISASIVVREEPPSLTRVLAETAIAPRGSAAQTMSKLAALNAYFDPKSRHNFFKKFFRSVYRRDSMFYFALNQPLPSISYKTIKLALGFLSISLYVQLKYSRSTRDWARSVSGKVMLVGTMVGIVCLAVTALMKLNQDISIEQAKKEERLKERAYQRKI